MRPIVWISEPISRALSRIPETIVVSSAEEFMDAPRDGRTVSFLDDSTLASLDRLATELSAAEGPRPEWRKLIAAVTLGPVIAVSSKPMRDVMASLKPHPWLSHVVSTAMLETPLGVEHVKNVMETLTKRGEPRLLDWLGPSLTGRRIRIRQASKRAERLDRMVEFFESSGVPQHTIKPLREVADELLTNAFYVAPVAAGAQKQPIARTQDVSFPVDSACDLVYGAREDLAIVRVRDPFGALTRDRLVELVTRGLRADTPAVGASTGGAELGLFRVFAEASIVAISVVHNQYTEILVGIENSQPVSPRPYAFHLFFKGGAKRTVWKSHDEDSGMTTSTVTVTMVLD